MIDFLYPLDTKYQSTVDIHSDLGYEIPIDRHSFILTHGSFFFLLHYSGAGGPGGPEFKAFQDEASGKEGIQFFTALADLPPVADGKKRLALISGRTADNPKFLPQCIKVCVAVRHRISIGCCLLFLTPKF